MKAVIWTRYGPPEALQLGEIDKPVPRDDQILIRILATTVTAGDCEMRRLQLPLGLSLPIRLYAGFFKPKRIQVLGQELAGIVEMVGKDVKSYRVGDEVFGTTGFGFGAYAEYICLPAVPNEMEGVLAAKPARLRFEEAAAVPTAGLEALHFIQKADLQPGDSVLIIGAGGSIGSFAIQLAKIAGAKVSGVDRTEKGEMIRSLGADRFIDYTREEYLTDQESYDLIIDVVGKQSVRKRLKMLKSEGTYFLAFANLSQLFLVLWTSLSGKKRFRIEASAQSKAELNELKALIEQGKLVVAVDRCYPLGQLPQAHQYCESGLKKGSVAIIVPGTEFQAVGGGRTD